MNERSGQTVRDWSGNGNHGTLGSTPVADDNDPTWIKGIFGLGSALSFDGNDFVTIPDSPSLRPESVTASAWFRGTESPGPFKYVVAKGADDCEAIRKVVVPNGPSARLLDVADGAELLVVGSRGTGGFRNYVLVEQKHADRVEQFRL